MRRLLCLAGLSAVLLIPAGASAQAPTLDTAGAQTATGNFVQRHARDIIDARGRASLDAPASDLNCVQQTAARFPRFYCEFSADISDRVFLGFTRVHIRSVHGGPQPPHHTKIVRRFLVRHFHCVGVVQVRAAFFRPSVSLVAKDCVQGRSTFDTGPSDDAAPAPAPTASA
jgi:hypothetical protein